MGILRRIGSEAMSSFFLAGLSLFLWHGIMPRLAGVGIAIPRSGAGGLIITLLVVAATYYLLLTLALYITRALNPDINAISTAYIGGWWIVALTAFLGVFDPVFEDILGLPMSTRATQFLFLTLAVGLLRFWREAIIRRRVMQWEQQSAAAGPSGRLPEKLAADPDNPANAKEA
ncbi:MAG TPA: hypothetical protein GXX29_10290 [Firmicutes bacterium]|nr:hypothetical protein [Bacillota bacterium]